MSATPLPQDIVDRFWRNVERRGETECWLWTGSSLKKGGRGIMWFNGKNVTAPRVAYSPPSQGQRE